MKKLLWLILTLSLLCACLPTPDNDIVINKSEGQLQSLIEQTTPVPVYQTEPTSATTESNPTFVAPKDINDSSPAPVSDSLIGTLRSVLHAPEYINDSFDGKAIGDKLTVVLDAIISIPNVSDVPVYTVNISIPNGEKRTRMFHFMLGDEPYYQPTNEQKMLIESRIKYCKNYIDALEKKPYGDDVPYEIISSALLNELQDLSIQLSAFPETAELLEATFDPSKRSVELMNSNYVVARQYQDANGVTVISYRKCNQAIDIYSSTGTRDPRNDQELSAMNVAESFASELGITETKAIGLFCADEDRRLKWHSQQGVDDGIYRVSLVPIYAGIPCYPYTTYYGSDSGRKEAKAEPDYNWNPPQETLFAVVQEGIVTQLLWQYPCEIVSMDNANVSLLSFDDIMKIFQKQIFMNVYLDAGYPETMHITNIRLSYMRMRKPDSKDYYLLPVWDFLGYCTDEDVDDLMSRSWYENQSFLTINAIDGSIIDRNVGY